MDLYWADERWNFSLLEYRLLPNIIILINVVVLCSNEMAMDSLVWKDSFSRQLTVKKFASKRC